ncbi:MAG TPA: ribosome maturation factor RimM [Bryobacterales bacterium]|nr:ribosome maturation factor RimM [Bryobacterales bacterium]
MSDSASDIRFVTIARLVRARGNRGELVADLESEDAEILKHFPQVHLWDGKGQRQAARILESWPHKNRLVLKFEGIDTIEQAGRLAGWEVQIPEALRPPAPPGRFYVADLVGSSVWDARSGRLLGQVSGMIETGAAPLLEVTGGERAILIPFAISICVEVDPVKRIIRVDLPEGLEELNRG